MAGGFIDHRDPELIEHTVKELSAERVMGLAPGYEDLNDHTTLRKDPAFQTAIEQDYEPASPSTLCRFENRTDRQTAWAIHQVIIEQFIASKTSPPSELILDFDATDDRVHGQQEGRFFHGSKIKRIEIISQLQTPGPQESLKICLIS